MSFLWNILGGKPATNSSSGMTVINTHTKGQVCAPQMILTDDVISKASKSLRRVAPAQIFVPPPSVSVHGISDKQLLWAKSHLRRITEENDAKSEVEDKKYKKVKVRRRRRVPPALPPEPKQMVRESPLPTPPRTPSPASPVFYPEYETWNW